MKQNFMEYKTKIATIIKENKKLATGIFRLTLTDLPSECSMQTITQEHRRDGSFATGSGSVQNIARTAKPGQFVNLYLNSESMLLPRPFGISDIVPAKDGGAEITKAENASTEIMSAEGSSAETAKAEDGSAEIAIVYAVVGAGTAALSEYMPGTEIEILAPQGNGYDLSNPGGHVLLIGGGLGIPPLVFAARRIRENAGMKNVRITALLGYRDEAYISSELEPYCDDVFDITDKEGTVMDLITRLEADGALTIPTVSKDIPFAPAPLDIAGAVPQSNTSAEPSTIADIAPQSNVSVEPSTSPVTALSCGPMPMLKVVAEWSAARGIPTQISLEERMGCGYGACVGCTIEITVYHNNLPVKERKKICKDGPVFPSTAIL